MTDTETTPEVTEESPAEAMQRRHSECFEEIRAVLERRGFRIVSMIDPRRMETVGDDGIILRAGWGLEPTR